MISDKKINIIVENTLRTLITESQESDSQKLAIKLVMDRLGYDKESANKFVRVTLKETFPSLRDKKVGKFTYGVTRMLLDGDLRDANIISTFNSTLKLLSAHIDEYDKNLNNLTARDIISRFAKIRQSNLEKSKAEINSLSFGQSDYRIVRIDSFEQAQEYYQYTNPDSRWCLTHMKNQYNSYTCNGINQLYFCLKNGFENVRQVTGENTPLDEYGLSMLSVIVNEDGELAFCTTRWNHANGGNDSAMNVRQISQTLNLNFYDTFKPNTKWQDLLADAQRRYRNGDELGSDIFDFCDRFYEGYAVVKLNDKYNYIDEDCNYLLDKWCDCCYRFKNGLARIEREKDDEYDEYECNVINRNGKCISDTWYDYISDFDNGFFKVRKNKTYNMMRLDGSIVSDQWFNYMGHNTSENYVFVTMNANGKRKVNFISLENGSLIYNVWFDDIGDYSVEDKVGVGTIGNKQNILKPSTGEIILNEWCDEIQRISHYHSPTAPLESPFFKAKLNDKYNIATANGLLLKEWSPYPIEDMPIDKKHTVFLIKNPQKCTFIDDTGKEITIDDLKAMVMMRENVVRLKSSDIKQMIMETVNDLKRKKRLLNK